MSAARREESDGELVIRPATVGDEGALRGLVAAFRDHLLASDPSDAVLRVELPVALGTPDLEFCCAWLAGAAVGYTHTRFFYSLWSGGTDALLEDLFVRDEARGRSVGRALLRHAVARARARGVRRFQLHTNEANRAGQALYRAEGLTPQSHALHPGGREVLWTRSLDP